LSILTNAEGQQFMPERPGVLTGSPEKLTGFLAKPDGAARGHARSS
jgi:hypothetical protein